MLSRVCVYVHDNVHANVWVYHIPSRILFIVTRGYEERTCGQCVVYVCISASAYMSACERHEEWV